jgi:CheY-like chemotaxis protein
MPVFCSLVGLDPDTPLLTRLALGDISPAQRREHRADEEMRRAALGAPALHGASSSTSSSPRLFAGRSRARAESRGDSISNRGPISVPPVLGLPPLHLFVPHSGGLPDNELRRQASAEEFIWQLMSSNGTRTADMLEPDSLPLNEDALDSSSGVGKGADNCLCSKLHMLFVDDIKVFRSLCGRFLHHLGCTFVVLEDGDEVEAAVADALAAGKPYDGIMLDIFMPRMGGAEVCAALRAKAFHLPIIAMTSAASDEEKENYYDIGFDVVLPKPFTVEDVCGALQEALSRRRDSRLLTPLGPRRQTASASPFD